MSVVTLRDALDKATGLPDYVPRLLRFWGDWMRGIQMPDLGYPKESTICRIQRDREGAAHGKEHPTNTVVDAIGLAVDRAVEDLTEVHPRMGVALVYRYYRGLTSKEGCKRLHCSQDVYDDLLKLGRWYMVAKLEPWKNYL